VEGFLDGDDIRPRLHQLADLGVEKSSRDKSKEEICGQKENS
jgi:hypothetical protein